MSTTSAVAPTGTGTSWWTGRSGLVIPLILGAFSTYILVGIFVMEVPAGTSSPGPKFFPTLIVVAGYLITALLVVHYLRHPEPAEPAVFSDDDDVSEAQRAEAAAAAAVSYRTFSDWVCLAWAIGGFAAFALLLNLLGWILAGALLFWCVARSMGSKKPVSDLVVSLMMSSLTYLAFDVLLGLNLPSGLLGGL